ENARATAAASPPAASTHTFDVVASYRTGAADAAAAVPAVTAGNGAQSTTTRSAPSRAALGVSATTMATTSPGNRARSAGIGRCGATNETSRSLTISSYGLPGIGV